jgi:hypothetical protein
MNAERIVVELLPRDIDHDQIMMTVVGYRCEAPAKHCQMLVYSNYTANGWTHGGYLAGTHSPHIRVTW